MKWYNRYTGFPYRHLGEEPIDGIDCFNLCTLIYKKELGIEIPYRTRDFCNIVDEDWYEKTHERWMDRAASEKYGWIKVKDPKVYDVILMSLGSTNVTNHCAMYVDTNKILQTMINHNSWIAPYGRYYKQYTVGVYRWKSLVN
jgi:cell wall-associated NlpC family hydrolase